MEYSDAMHRLVSGADGRVYLDTTSPRVCLKGPEERDGLGYGLLAEEDVFPFFELRSAAIDMRGASQKSYDDAELRKRVAAQLDTCREAGATRRAQPSAAARSKIRARSSPRSTSKKCSSGRSTSTSSPSPSSTRATARTTSGSSKISLRAHDNSQDYAQHPKKLPFKHAVAGSNPVRRRKSPGSSVR